MKTVSTFIVHKPVIVAWNFFDNPENMGLWLKGFKRFELVSGTQGHIGSKSRHIYEQGGKEFVLQEEITARQKYHHFAATLTHKTMVALVDTTFTDLHDGRTELHFTNDISFHTFLYRLISPFIHGSILKREEGDYLRLKTAIEAEKD